MRVCYCCLEVDRNLSTVILYLHVSYALNAQCHRWKLHFPSCVYFVADIFRINDLTHRHIAILFVEEKRNEKKNGRDPFYFWIDIIICVCFFFLSLSCERVYNYYIRENDKKTKREKIELYSNIFLHIYALADTHRQTARTRNNFVWHIFYFVSCDSFL